MPAASSSSTGARAAAKLGVVVLLAAGVFGVAPLYVPGLTFVVLGVGCIAWVASGARGVSVARTLGAGRVVEGAPLDVRISVGGSRVALPSCVIEDPLLDAPRAVRGGRRTAELRFDASFERRGRHRLRPPAAIVRDPLGLARRGIVGDDFDEVLVLPRVEAIRAAPDGAGESGTVTRRARPGIAPSAEVDLDGLRPYREGAPASRIHWAALARTGELIERRLRPEGDTRPLILLDTRGQDDERLDAAVRAAASLCVHLAGLGGCALLLPGERRPSPLEPGLAGWPHLHARLALVRAGGAPALSGLAARRGAIFYVAARPVSRIPPVLAHAPAAGRVLVVPAPLGGRRASFTVAGCTGYDLTPARARRAA